LIFMEEYRFQDNDSGRQKGGDWPFIGHSRPIRIHGKMSEDEKRPCFSSGLMK